MHRTTRRRTAGESPNVVDADKFGNVPQSKCATLVRHGSRTRPAQFLRMQATLSNRGCIPTSTTRPNPDELVLQASLISAGRIHKQSNCIMFRV